MPSRGHGRPELTPDEFTRRMPEGEGAGPGAPETVEPVTGRPGAAGHGPRGTPAPTITAAATPDAAPAPAAGARPDLIGILGFASWSLLWTLARPAGRLAAQRGGPR
jgi:hypothetical protein